MSFYVFYCDGSAKPNPGYTGWGVHGYKYSLNAKEVRKKHHPNGFVPTANGYIQEKESNKEEIVAISSFYEFFGSHSINNTNNVAEMQAITQAMYFIKEEMQKEKIESVILLTDSTYTRRGLEDWCVNWEKNGWIKTDGNPVINSNIWKEIYTLKKELEKNIPNFKVTWTKGHAGEPGNEMADQLADMGVNLSVLTGSVIETTPQVHRCSFEPGLYWNYQTRRHPLLHFKRLYFNNSDIVEKPKEGLFSNQKQVYYLAHPGDKDILFGNGTQDAAYAVINMSDNVDSIINLVKQVQQESAQGSSTIARMNLDKLYQPSIMRFLEAHRRHALVPRIKSRINVHFLDDTPLSEEIFPPGQIYRALEIFTLLERKLVNYNKMLEDEIKQKQFNETKQSSFYCSFTKQTINFYDATEIFYETTVKKNIPSVVLRKDIPQGKNIIPIPIKIVDEENSIKEVTLSALLGSDLPPRNSLKRIETESPRIVVVWWSIGNKVMQCAYIVELRALSELSKDMPIKGIWSNFFANTFVSF